MARKTASAASKLRTRALTADDWPVIERLFGSNGACGGCWCMSWRVPRGGKLWEEQKGEPNRRNFRKLVRDGRVFGALAFCGDDPVGWCCVGPRADFPRLERTKALSTEWNVHTWSVTCFYIPARWRHKGIATKLLDEAVAVASANGAGEIEGYPVVSKQAANKDIPAAFAWTGVPPVFERNGFVQINVESEGRPIYRRGFRRRRGQAARVARRGG